MSMPDEGTIETMSPQGQALVDGGGMNVVDGLVAGTGQVQCNQCGAKSDPVLMDDLDAILGWAVTHSVTVHQLTYNDLRIWGYDAYIPDGLVVVGAPSA